MRESLNTLHLFLFHILPNLCWFEEQQTKPTRKTVKSWPTLYQSVPNPGVVNKNIPIFSSQIQEISWYVNQISSKSSVILYQHCVCVCAVDTSCAHFPLSQLPPLIFSTHSYLQNSPLTKQVVLHYKCYFTDSLLYSNKTFYLQVLHYSYWNSDSKIVLHFIFNRKTKIFNIPAQKRICSSLISSKYVHHKNLLKSRWDKN